MAEHVGVGCQVFGGYLLVTLSHTLRTFTWTSCPPGPAHHDYLLKTDTKIDSMKERGLSFPFMIHRYILSV